MIFIRDTGRQQINKTTSGEHTTAVILKNIPTVDMFAGNIFKE